MRFLDLSADPTLPPMLDLLRHLTRAETSREVFAAFLSRYGRVRPVEHLISVAPDPDAPGAYRIVFSSATSANGDPVVGVDPFDPDRVASLPLHRGGLIAELIKDQSPKLVFDLDTRSDPVLSRHTTLPTCMVVPVFNGDTIEQWTLGFSGRSDGFQARDVGQASLTANLLGIANRNLDALNTIRHLNAQWREQLEQISRLQQSLLPARLPDIPGVEIATSYLTSNESGGDYYDFFQLPGGRWGILIADVSGHGAAAATVMAMLHAILHCYAPEGEAFDPAAAMRFANDRLLASGLDGSFVTAFFAVFDPVTGELTYSNCGHNPPRRKHGHGGHIVPIEDAATLPLGVLSPLESQTATLTLHAGDTLILYTDGIVEAFSPEGEQYGTERMDEALRACSGAPDCVVESIHRTLFSHRRSATRDDDQTIVALRYHGLCAVGTTP